MFKVTDVGFVTVTELTEIPVPLKPAVVTPLTKLVNWPATTTLKFV
jgi:hypothetical protein